MALCQNRPDGFVSPIGSSVAIPFVSKPLANLRQSLYSAFTTNFPSTCFNDVIVVPLATWLYIVALFFAFIRKPKILVPNTKKGGLPVPPPPRPPTNRMRFLKGLYMFLILALIALVSVEIARLSMANLGIGLLPFTYMGLIVALTLRLIVEHKRKGWKWKGFVGKVNLLFWILLAAAMAIKLTAEVLQQRKFGRRLGLQGRYPIPDEVTDDAVVIGMLCAIFVLEIVAF